jgi:hypothetical protein
MVEKKDVKEWKKVLVRCLEGLSKEGIVPQDVKELTGRIVLDLNMSQGGITDMDISVKRKFK